MGFLERGAVLTRNRNDKVWKPTTISDYTLSRKQQDKRLAALSNFNVFWAWASESWNISKKPDHWLTEEVLDSRKWTLGITGEVEKNKGIIAKLLGILK